MQLPARREMKIKALNFGGKINKIDIRYTFLFYSHTKFSAQGKKFQSLDKGGLYYTHLASERVMGLISNSGMSVKMSARIFPEEPDREEGSEVKSC